MGETHDQLYHALSNERRRRLLFSLLNENPQTDSLNEFDVSPNAASADEMGSIEDQHVHLPKLDDYGFIDWDPSTCCIERGPRFDEIRHTLELLAAHHETHPPNE